MARCIRCESGGAATRLDRASHLSFLSGSPSTLRTSILVELLFLVAFLHTKEIAMIDSSVKESPFLMAIEEVFTKAGTETVVVGTVERGVIHVGDELEIVGFRPVVKTTCLAVDSFGASLKEAKAGDRVGILLRDIQREDMQRGRVLTTPGSCSAHALFYASLYIYTQEEGGRRSPVYIGYKPQFYFRGFDVTGTLELPSGVEGKPGDTIDNARVSLVLPVAMDAGLSFAMKEGARIVGSGIVTATR